MRAVSLVLLASCNPEPQDLFEFCGERDGAFDSDDWTVKPPRNKDFTATFRAYTAEDCVVAWDMAGTDDAFRCVDCESEMEYKNLGAWTVDWTFLPEETDTSGADCADSWVAALLDPPTEGGFDTEAERRADLWNHEAEALVFQREFGYGEIHLGPLTPFRGFDYADWLGWFGDPDDGTVIAGRYQGEAGAAGCEARLRFR